MKLAVSNIAWPALLDAEAYGILRANDIDALEVAPTRVWPQWEGINPAAVSAFRKSVQAAGLMISSMQSLTFQKPELALFSSREQREAMEAHLRFCADLAGDLGATRLVFGSPKNRDRGSLSEDDAVNIATEFFSNVGAYYAKAGVCLVFEANPKEYGCNFATDSRTAVRLVRAANSPGFGLHLDTACLQFADEDGASAVSKNIDILRHVHASEPFLGSFATPVAKHIEMARALENAGYTGYVALEMRSGDEPMSALDEATRFLRETYGCTR